RLGLGRRGLGRRGLGWRGRGRRLVLVGVNATDTEDYAENHDDCSEAHAHTMPPA
ncbi:MAG: hypothetical protein H0T89_02635, partial [Deltaproteobacteria bacterium]|nr:hypothetical protein [Deltaproteobacteria bacterium]